MILIQSSQLIQPLAVLTIILLLGTLIAFITGLGLFRGFKIAERYSEIDLSKEIKTATIAGIVGGFFFATVSPFLLPPVTTIQSAVAPQIHDPQFEAKYVTDFADTAVNDTVDIVPEDDYHFYILSIYNSNNRPINELSIHANFKGCVKSRKARRYLTNDPRSLPKSRLVVKGTNAGCRENIYIKELPANRRANVQYIVDTEPADHSPTGEIGCIYLSIEYNWERRGHSYERRTKIPVTATQVKYVTDGLIDDFELYNPDSSGRCAA